MDNDTKGNNRRTDGAEAPSVSVPADGKVYVLIDGQKTGPFTMKAIAEMVSAHDLLITDSISSDGENWFFLYQWQEFDRRSIRSEELPGAPQINLLVNSDKEVDESLINRGVMAGMAHLGNVKTGKRHQHQNDKYLKSGDNKTSLDKSPGVGPSSFEKKSTKRKTYLWGAVLSFAIIGIFYMALSPDSNKKVAAKQQDTQKISKVKTKVRKVKTNSLTRKAKKSTTRNVVKARKKTPSFSKSKAFKNRAPRRKPAAKARIEKPVVEDPDDYYYDDGTDPVELDPIRSKLAKETFDPEDENLDEYLDEIDADREPASDLEEDPEKAFEALYE